MDTHIAAHPPVEAESGARLPEEAGKPLAADGFPEEDPGPRVRLPREAAEPLASEGFDELSGVIAPERLPVSTLTPQDTAPGLKRRLGLRRLTPRQRLFLGVAVIALAAMGASAYLVSPYNHVYPVPYMASTVRHWAAEAGVTRPEPLAPAASLAGVPTSPAKPVVREKYQPKKKDQQLRELLALHGGASAAAQVGDQARDGSPPATSVPGKVAAGSGPPAAPGRDPDAGPNGRDAPPPGYVPSEPGSQPASPAVPTEPVQGSRVPARDQGSPEAHAAGSAPGIKPPADAAVGGASLASPPPAASAPSADATAAVVASLSKPSDATPPSAPAPPPAALEPRADPRAPVTPAPDPLKLAGELRAAPLASQDQVQILELVTQMAAMVRDLRTQDAQLRADFGKAAADNTARLVDFEPRLALSEARNAVSTAKAVGESAASVSPAAAGTDPAQPSAPAPVTKPAPGLVSAAAALPSASAGAGLSDQGAAKRYRVQAASPGLALLAEIDRGGGDGAQLEVLVGDKIPGYGKVTSIGQRGTAWVVATEHGTIQ